MRGAEEEGWAWATPRSTRTAPLGAEHLACGFFALAQPSSSASRVAPADPLHCPWFELGRPPERTRRIPSPSERGAIEDRRPEAREPAGIQLGDGGDAVCAGRQSFRIESPMTSTRVCGIQGGPAPARVNPLTLDTVLAPNLVHPRIVGHGPTLFLDPVERTTDCEESVRSGRIVRKHVDGG